ncbi:MAG: M3 family metallopeptidase [Melioribacteraceae bacterium]|nr:M3 family metallopeptidase [Melioribacteraceae bacterium]MCF8354902.1 M3 family metallopeptidase [Melioribacteraceae bacterium]MCF8396041.1 M3 family metallopeptidase [Melioribacteraceae bacterium]MCF8421062.1 M3 family metallopeptidase [Melioribacteraceae bacterium]
MKRILFTSIIIGLLFMACEQKETNPLIENWDTPFQTPPFDKINNGHYLPAFKTAVDMHKKEIEKIVDNPEAPTFENTIEALEYSGSNLTRVANVFSAMSSAMINDELLEISREVSPLLSKHNDDINLNPELFARVKAVHDQKENIDLTKEQEILLDKYYKDFIRGGANLNDTDKAAFRKINDELSMLSLKFGENVLKETNKFQLVIEDESDLAGLPQGVIDAASDEAKSKGYENKWLFTIQKPSMIPFLQYSQKRDLKEKIYKAYINKGDNGDSLDNKKNLTKMAALRLKRANLLGYPTHAHFVLEEQMAKTPDNVYDLLNKLWEPALKVAKQERDEMQKMIYEEGDDFKLESWDWWYYAEKVKKAKYAFDEEEVRPYFQVKNVINGVFGLATDLFGIQFVERNDIPKYHPDVKTFEVKDKDGSHIGILYTDYFPRESKRGGAWMDAFRKQSRKNGEFIHPVIYNVGNFSKPTADKPSLLSIDEVNTLFHEFGHALHGLLSDCTYETLSGTATPRDFVEFPSQVMENWCMHPQVIKKYAKHYKTGEVIPDELIEKINNSSKFNQGFATVEYLAASFLDMDWHSITEPMEYDAAEFENKSLNKIGLIPEIISRYRSTYFNHIFAGGYSSGYYSYIWSEVLDADAFRAFVESGDVLNQELAQKYRTFILASGGMDDAMELYRKFRGKDPEIEPLLVKRGLK